MLNILVLFGSSSGNTEDAAQRITHVLGKDNCDLKNIANVSTLDFSAYKAVLLGTSTWGIGDIQDDWEAKLTALENSDLKGKKAAVFGLGDAEGYADSFVDGIADLYDAAKKAGAEMVGHSSTDGYDYDESKAERDGQFLGLVLDEDNQADQTDQRISDWVKGLGL